MKHTGEIKGDLVFKKGDDATKVTSIGGSLYVRQGATCDLPVCTSIGGSQHRGFPLRQARRDLRPAGVHQHRGLPTS